MGVTDQTDVSRYGSGHINDTFKVETARGVAGSESEYVSEGGSRDITFRLSSAPATNMTISVRATDPKFQLSATALIFTPSNWGEPQTVGVSCAEDAFEEAVQGAIVCGTGGDDCVSG